MQLSNEARVRQLLPNCILLASPVHPRDEGQGEVPLSGRLFTVSSAWQRLDNNTYQVHIDAIILNIGWFKGQFGFFLGWEIGIRNCFG